uniref:Putative flagellar associated protein n=1 Tax=Trepomonas sp. PC1 TaxID=1076344 RepID=A0A146KFR1_9EUKA|eukprot:JAP94316.1 Putative flagellar associated protein [Trepomonas sp. PC1]
MIIVWDSQQLKPVRTYRLQHSVLRMDLSDDGALIAILTDSSPQQLQIFEWAASSELPLVKAVIQPNLGLQRDIRFNPSDYRQLVTNSAFKTTFWSWVELVKQNLTEQFLQQYSPDTNDFKTQPSAFTVSCFLPKTNAALTATVAGEVVLWDCEPSQQKRAVKLLILHTSNQSCQQVLPQGEIQSKNEQILFEPPSVDYLVPGPQFVQAIKTNNKNMMLKSYYEYLTEAFQQSQQMTSTATQSFTQAITYMHAKHDGFVITGGLDGSVRMFDFRLRLLSWYENLEAGPITSISIVMPLQAQIDNQLSQAAVQLLPGTMQPDKKQDQLKQQFGSVILRDFIVGTQRGSIILVPAAVFELVEPEKRRGQPLYQGLPGKVTAQFVSQKQEENEKPLQYIATDRGDVLVFDYQKNQILTSQSLVGDINASNGAKLKGTLAQRHSEGFEQCSFLLANHPLKKIKTMRYPHVTSMELQGSLLVCGTSLGSCLLLDAKNLNLLSSFSHLSTLKQFVPAAIFQKEEKDFSQQIPAQIKFVKISQGDVIVTVDEVGLLTVLSKTDFQQQKMDLTTGRFQDSTVNEKQPLTQNLLQNPPKFVTEFEEAVDKEEKRTAADVRIHPAALLARANQKRREAASSAGQWQNLGKVQVSSVGVTGCMFLAVDLYDETLNKQIKRKRDQLVLIAKDRFLTIIDIQKTVEAIEPDRVVVDRRFRLDQEATPTAICFLKQPPKYFDDEQAFMNEIQHEGNLKSEINQVLLSLQSEKYGLVNATMRPELQPVDQRDLLVIANDQYKLQLRQLQRFSSSSEVSSRTVITTTQAITNPTQQTHFFMGGYNTQYPLLQVIKSNDKANEDPPIASGVNFCQNSRLAGPLPLRKTVTGPTFAQHLSQMVQIDYEMSNNDFMSKQTVNDKFKYRTDFEILNQAGAVRHKCQYIAFSTPEKVIGVMRTPLDGAPHRYVGIIASAGQILQIDVAFCLQNESDGTTYLISSGCEDCCSFLWEIDYSALDLTIDTQVQQDFSNLDPFLSQIQGGSSGDYYALIQQYFSYSQIYISEQKGQSPSENARAPVSMLGDMLRALGVFINNEHLQNAIAEVTEEEVRQKRLQFYLFLVKKAYNTKKLPPPFDQRSEISKLLEFDKNDLKPFMNQQLSLLNPLLADLKAFDEYWEEEKGANEQFEQTLWEAIGGNEITISLDDFVRILVNYRKVQIPGFEALKQAFDIIGAKGGMVDKATFLNTLQEFGEKLTMEDLENFLKELTAKGLPVQYPDHLSAEEFGRKYLQMELQEELEVPEQGEEMEE